MLSQNKTPLVSIVIPTYNHAAYLSQAIDSVLNQKYKNIELIVLDDGSTDGTAQVLNGYGNQFHWESQKNIGQSATLNKGWSMAQGEILAYLSADDLLYPDAVSRSVDSLLKQDNAVLSYCDFNMIDPESRIVRRVNAPEYSFIEMLTKFICAPSAGAFFWRSAYLKTGGWNPDIHRFPDYDYWLRLGLQGSFLHLHESLAAYRVHEGSQTFSEPPVARTEEAIKVITNFYAIPNLPAQILSLKSEAVANAHLLVAQLHLRAGRYLDASREVYKAACFSPRSLFSVRTLRMLINGLFNRHIHKILWRIRGGKS